MYSVCMNHNNSCQVVGEAQGAEDALQNFRKDLNEGPPAAHVVKVEVNKIEIKSGESSFSTAR